MPDVAVDTSVLLAFVDTDDPNHDLGRRIVEKIDRGTYPTSHVTNYVVLETLNWIHSKEYHQMAVEVYGSLEASAGFEIVQVAQRDYARAIELFRTHDTPAFGDCTIAAYMERRDLEFVYTFDPDDFEVFDGVSPLTSPVNPFEPG